MAPRSQTWAKPFVWRDPATIPPREWLYGGHYIRRFVTMTASPGGLGKSALALTEACAMVTGRDLLGVAPNEADLKVWYWNGEDPFEETEKRIAAIILEYDLDVEKLELGLFTGSGREAELVIGTMSHEGALIQEPNVDAIIDMITTNGIDLAIIDPFVSSHRVTENDNMAVDRVAKTWARIAEEAGCGVELVHHVRKGTRGEPTTVEDGRGAVALLAAARSARVLNVMSPEEAAQADVKNPRSHFSVTNGKSNLAPPPEHADWRVFHSRDLGNAMNDRPSDSVGVVHRWVWPDKKTGPTANDLARLQAQMHGHRWRMDKRSPHWIGHLIATVMEWDRDATSTPARVGLAIEMWAEAGFLEVYEDKDAQRRTTKFIRVGKPVDLSERTYE